MGRLIDCKQIQENLLKRCVGKGEGITFLIVNDKTSPASEVYVRNKVKLCEHLGILTVVKETLNLHDLNAYDYIMVQKPCGWYNERMIEHIPPEKDADCLTALNRGVLYERGIFSKLTPCTPRGIMEMIYSEYGHGWLRGKDVVIVGRSNIVGRPLALLMEKSDATVTVCHSHTRNLKEKCKKADVLVCATGQPKFFNRDFVKEGALVIDVGINRDENGKLCGDVDTEDVLPVCEAITPVPGGVGLLTTASLMLNLVQK